MNTYERYSPEISVQACGRAWRLTRPAGLEELWAAMGEDDLDEDERLPYWVELWPSSLALGEWLHRKQDLVRRGLCLDLGCGLGLTALIASWLGAKVLAMDYEPEALVFARKNATLNRVPQPFWSAMDWRFPAVSAQSISCIWGGDIMYERRFVRPVLDFLAHALAPNGRVWLAEPGRDIFEHFRSALVAGGWKAELVHSCKVDPLYAQPQDVTVKLWELGRG